MKKILFLALSVILFFTHYSVHSYFDEDIEDFSQKSFSEKQEYLDTLKDEKENYYSHLSSSVKKTVDLYNNILPKKISDQQKMIQLIVKIERILQSKKAMKYKDILQPIVYQQQMNILQNMVSQISPKEIHLDTVESHIFKVASYKENKFANTYELSSIGSSVLIDENTLVTNAHVVLDEEGNMYDFITLCNSQSFLEVPKCKYTGQVTYYDTEKDIAYIDIDSNDIFGESVPVFVTTITFQEKEIVFGSDLHIYGYPNIGGNTITFTQGKVSGFSEGKYKTDAVIDHGNSGGGVFDDNGNLVGISVSIMTDNNTIGYIIPYKDIQKFDSEKNKFSIKSEISKNINTEALQGLQKEYLYKNKIQKDYKEKGVIIKDIFDGYENEQFDIFYSNNLDYINIELKDEDYFSIVNSRFIGENFSKGQLENYFKKYYFQSDVSEKCTNVNDFVSCYVKGEDQDYYVEYKILDTSVLLFYITINSNNFDNETAKEFVAKIKDKKLSFYDDSLGNDIAFGDIQIQTKKNKNMLAILDVDMDYYYPEYNLGLFPTSPRYNYIGYIAASDRSDMKEYFEKDDFSKKAFYEDFQEGFTTELRNEGIEDIQMSLGMTKYGAQYVLGYSASKSIVHYTFVTKDLNVYTITFFIGSNFSDARGVIDDFIYNLQVKNTL